MALVTPAEIATLDPYYENVVLLLSANGANGSTVFTDNSHHPTAVTAFGNAYISTAQSKFGGASAYFDNSVLSGLSVPYSSKFAFGNQDFTIETWVYLTGANPNGARLWNADGDFFHEIDLSLTNGLLGCYGSISGSAWDAWAAPSIGAVALNTQTHVAVDRVGGTVTAYINGVGVVLTSSLGSAALSFGTNGGFYRTIGGQSSGVNRSLLGYVDDLRVTLGVARHTSNFTPPADEFPWLAGIPNGYHAFGSLLSRTNYAPPEAQDALGVRNNILLPQRGQRDIYYGGTGQITGTVKEKGTPDAPLHRRVCLIEEPSRTLIRETWSDALTGAYVFPNVDRSRSYTVLSYDHTNVYRAVIADKQIPELMP